MANRRETRHARRARDGRPLWRSVAAVAMLAGLAGCARHPVRPDVAPANEGDASWRPVEQPGTVHYQLAMGEVSSGGTAQQRVTPAYPAARLAACPPVVEVTAKLIVDRSGRVAEVRPGGAAAAAADLAPYLDATRTAALHWRFHPLQIERWAADADGESHVVDRRTEPFSLDYLFRFSCRAGKAQVTTGKLTPG